MKGREGVSIMGRSLYGEKERCQCDRKVPAVLSAGKLNVRLSILHFVLHLFFEFSVHVVMIITVASALTRVSTVLFGPRCEKNGLCFF